MWTKINQAKLVSLGFAFYGEPSRELADPERTILELLPTFFEDRKVFRILLRWLINTSELIHIERLATLAKEASPDDKAVLGALALKLAKLGDRRWVLIAKNTKHGLGRRAMNRTAPKGYSDPYLIHKYGTDSEFTEFGIRTSTVLPEEEKKVLTLQAILRHHSWLRIRALIGTNFRADLLYLKSAGKVCNANQAAKELGCSRETAYRLWQSVSVFTELKWLAEGSEDSLKKTG